MSRFGFGREYRRRVDEALAGIAPTSHGASVTEDDLVGLPAPVAEYVRRSGGVGAPRLRAFRAQVHGRIRSAPDATWMPFKGEQVNTFGPIPTRVFHIMATRSGLPVDVLHTFVDDAATMRVRLCGLIPMVDACGPQMDQGETVTVFNDLCVLAPAALVDAPVTWQPIDDHQVGGTFTMGPRSVSATLVFDDQGDLVDFVSDDRLRSSADGKHFEAQRWSTPVGSYRTFDGYRIATVGEGRWHAPEPEGTFAYIEFIVDELSVNP